MYSTRHRSIPSSGFGQVNLDNEYSMRCISILRFAPIAYSPSLEQELFIDVLMLDERK